MPNTICNTSVIYQSYTSQQIAKDVYRRKGEMAPAMVDQQILKKPGTRMDESIKETQQTNLLQTKKNSKLHE